MLAIPSNADPVGEGVEAAVGSAEEGEGEMGSSSLKAVVAAALITPLEAFPIGGIRPDEKREAFESREAREAGRIGEAEM